MLIDLLKENRKIITSFCIVNEKFAVFLNILLFF